MKQPSLRLDSARRTGNAVSSPGSASGIVFTFAKAPPRSLSAVAASKRTGPFRDLPQVASWIGILKQGPSQNGPFSAKKRHFNSGLCLIGRSLRVRIVDFGLFIASILFTLSTPGSGARRVLFAPRLDSLLNKRSRSCPRLSYRVARFTTRKWVSKATPSCSSAGWGATTGRSAGRSAILGPGFARSPLMPAMRGKAIDRIVRTPRPTWRMMWPAGCVAIGAGPAHVLGQSLGGLVAQELALRHPDG